MYWCPFPPVEKQFKAKDFIQEFLFIRDERGQILISNKFRFQEPHMLQKY